jgi:hypothetical protein
MRTKEGKFLNGCTPNAAHRWRNHGYADNQEGQEAKFQRRGYDQVLAALFPRTPGPYQREYYTRQITTFCRELRIRWGPVGVRPPVIVGFGVASHPLGPDQVYYYQDQFIQISSDLQIQSQQCDCDSIVRRRATRGVSISSRCQRASRPWM